MTEFIVCTSKRSFALAVNDSKPATALTKKRVLQPESVKAITSGQLTVEQVEWLYKPTIAAQGAVLWPGTAKQWGFGCLVLPEGSPSGRGEGTATWAGLFIVRYDRY